jgi:hypothetical protein
MGRLYGGRKSDFQKREDENEGTKKEKREEKNRYRSNFP